MDYVIHIAVLFCIFSILAVTLNLIVGFTGLPSVAHAGFYGIGAYTTAILTTRLGADFFLSIIGGLVLAGGIALFLGIVLGRFRDDYFLLVTLGFVSIMNGVFLNLDSLTRGPLGITGIARPVVFGVPLLDPSLYLLLAAFALVVTYMSAHGIVASSFGRVLKGIREDEDALKVFGYKTGNYKMVVVIISACGAALAGSLYASYISFVDPSTFTIHDSVYILAIIILGGLASLRGSLLGALTLVLLPEILRFIGFSPDIAGQMRVFIYGALLIFFMMYRPQGLVGEYKL